MPYRRLAYLPDRRSSRVETSVPIAISGLDVSRSPYYEEVSALSISCHGCRYRSKNRVGIGDVTILEVVALQGMPAKWPTLARVRSLRLLPEAPTIFDVAVELELPRNIWTVDSPPEDWKGFEQAGACTDTIHKLHAVAPFEARRSEVSHGKRTPVELASISEVPGERRVPALPPFRTHPVAALREPTQTAGFEAAKNVSPKRPRESLDELCAQLQNKAGQIFEGLIANLAKELIGRSRRAGQIPSLEAFEGNVACGFEQAAPDSARRSA